MNNKEKINLWNECRDMFSSVSNNNLDNLLRRTVLIVNRYQKILSKVADLNFLEYIIQLNSSDYQIGLNGDDYEMILKKYVEIEIVSLKEIWRILSQLVWDLCTAVTTEICPNCHCDELILLTDKTEKHLYKSCETCFWTSEDGLQVKKPKELYPAKKSMLNM